MQCSNMVPAYLSNTRLFTDPLTRIHGAIFNANVFLQKNKKKLVFFQRVVEGKRTSPMEVIETEFHANL